MLCFLSNFSAEPRAGLAAIKDAQMKVIGRRMCSTWVCEADGEPCGGGEEGDESSRCWLGTSLISLEEVPTIVLAINRYLF
jgi:hypothetical protein